MKSNKTNKLNLFVALKIAEHYPLGILLIPVIDEETGLHTASVWRCDDDKNPIDILFHDNDYSSKTEFEAVQKLVKLLKVKMKEIKIMSN